LVDVAAHAGHKVLMENDNNILPIVGDFRTAAQASPNALTIYFYCKLITH
jgi:hypothetical protein